MIHCLMSNHSHVGCSMSISSLAATSHPPSMDLFRKHISPCVMNSWDPQACQPAILIEFGFFWRFSSNLVMHVNYTRLGWRMLFEWASLYNDACVMRILINLWPITPVLNQYVARLYIQASSSNDACVRWVIGSTIHLLWQHYSPKP
jgi:hypothetical protein